MSAGRPVAIITGAGRGIGRATAAELSRRGFACVLMARNPADLQETARLCEVARVAPGDVTREADVARVVASVEAEFRRIDVLINNAGSAPVSDIEQTTPADFRATLEANLTSAFLMSRAVWPIMKRRGGGVIVNVSSLSARDPFPTFTAYAPAKAGLNGLGLVLARQGAAFNIRVHTIAPGAVETTMLRSIADESVLPPDRVMSPADVARVIAACADGTLACASGEVIYLRRHAE